MQLTDAETEEAAQRLARTSGETWSGMSELNRVGMRMLVRDLAAAIDAERSPEALLVFMTWMGDE
jgi:hypothetical protein